MRSGRSAVRDCSITQFAQIDDDNVSALQQVTKGGGGLTLASQWKSQFDDSEETDNEWKGENLQSPEHKGTNVPSIPPQVKILFCYNKEIRDNKQKHIMSLKHKMFE